MSDSTYDQELSPFRVLAIKREIINAWISDFPQTPPTPESISPTTQHRHRYTSQVLQDCRLEGRHNRSDAPKEVYTLPLKVCRSARLWRSRGMMEEDTETSL